ncbi:sugar phosphate isomerase/epimerase family protein [Allorhodopirellula heiligendammensis]|uniref:Xylose isomerase-like TIM barrel n=1 Tax=Allorhodopirellula heiligendammensis TaxID=2714739 RepID=A0A5C6BIE7_9BACT|nr:sugar phosphate isomerase/epimerase [Allorhodopirellula heiligendammensis]TWU11096.1 Xylose isomerase-like TIM barrel [Allorhodopirellula heiligendammensis]
MNRPESPPSLSRRQFSLASAAAVGSLAIQASSSPARAAELEATPFRLNYLLASSMYGHVYLGDILPEVAQTGATAIDLWPRPHGSQREQLDAIGEEKLIAMLGHYNVTVGCLSRFDLSAADRQGEMRRELKLAGRLGCPCVVTAGRGPKNLSGGELKSAVKQFVEDQKRNIDVAEANNVRLAIENHSNNLIDSPDSLKWLAEFAPSSGLAIALAPYHLPQDPALIAGLIESLGPSIALFYAWEHGMGSMKRLPKEQELTQMPGRGMLDFRPLLAALQKIQFSGWTEIFMHPVPRGIPILESEAKVTEEINVARAYLERLLR